MQSIEVVAAATTHRCGICRYIGLGHMAYDDAWVLQKELAVARGKDEMADTLLRVEHPHTYTLGNGGNMANVLLTPDELRERGIVLVRSDRGGDVTYHGPGQLVYYPILRLAPGEDGLHADVITYIRRLEATIIGALAEFDIVAGVIPGLTGVWVGINGPHPAKIAAIGVRVTTKRVTMHGLALNVNTNMGYFKGIIPCGIKDKAVTSMAALARHKVDIDAVHEAICRAFEAQFNVKLRKAVI
jgi:lipoyl(octanoyl) transferase